MNMKKGPVVGPWNTQKLGGLENPSNPDQNSAGF